MCSYCGCEAEPLILALMDDHAVIADLAYRVGQALDAGQTATVRSLMAELAERFRVHSWQEESGLFAELARAGEATAELARLVADHDRLRPLLAAPDIASQPDRLRHALAELAEHAQTEDNDLFPYALQVLPTTSWDQINGARGRSVGGDAGGANRRELAVELTPGAPVVIGDEDLAEG